MTDIGPRDVAAVARQWWWMTLIAVVLACTVVLGGWQAGWWFAGQNVNRQTKIIQNSDSNQTALVQQVDTQIGNVATATVQMDGVARGSQQWEDLHAQRLGFARLACQDASQITIRIAASQSAWISRNCQAGNLSPASPLYR